MDKKEILDILDNAKDDRGAVPMRLVRQALDKLSAIQPISSVQPKPDCVSRQAAIDALDEIESEVADGYGYQYEKWRKYFCELPSAQPEQRWIPCSERMPGRADNVIICYKAGDYTLVSTGRYLYKFKMWYVDVVGDLRDGVIAWMPLPEPYRGGDSE